MNDSEGEEMDPITQNGLGNGSLRNRATASMNSNNCLMTLVLQCNQLQTSL